MAKAVPPPDSPLGDGRWQAFLRHSSEPLFLLNRQRRVLFANSALEAATGLPLTDLRGRRCRPHRERAPETDDAVLAVLAPPADALAGKTCRARRRAPGSAGHWWQLDFFPVLGTDGLLGILGKITPLPTVPPVLAQLPEQLMALRDRHAESFRLDSMPRELPSIMRVQEQAQLAAQGRMPVTLIGEAGTGKHWLARAIHQASTARDRCFACLDCRALPPALMGDMLFEPSGRRLAMGTIYLREPAEMPREWQDRLTELLHTDDDGSRPRVIVGHRTDAAEAVRAGRLVEALHCAASTLTIHLPPLRERLADLDGLVGTFLARAGQLATHKAGGLSPEAAVALRAHTWPGNLRELYDVLREACARAKGERIEVGNLPFYLRSAPLPAEKPLKLDELLADAERQAIRLALRKAKGNRTKAAEMLGIWRPRLLRRMEHFGIEAVEAGEERTDQADDQ